MMLLNISATESTPEVKLENNFLFLKGEIRPEFPKEFFEPIHKSILEFKENDLTINFEISYINSSSILQLKKLLFKLNENSYLNYVRVCWFYSKDDDEMLEIGEYLSELSEIKFEYIVL